MKNTGTITKNYVYVINQRGKPLMPCSPGKARILLKQNRARVVQRTPFTIQLTYATGETTQPITLGVDSGYEHVGLSAVSEDKELFAAEVLLRKDISNLLTERRMYRRNRRSRQTRYRKARFLNRVRTKHKGWLAPSIQHKLDSHLRAVQKVAALLPLTRVIVEVANFDIQKIKNPDIQGVGYQQGDQLGYDNVRAYVLHRDGHKCQYCKGSSKDVHLNAHHIIFRSQGGSDRPDNLITLCETCHKLQHKVHGGLKLKIKVSKGFRAETFMSTVRWKLVDLLRATLPKVSVGITYGYITKALQQRLALVKSHINDAYCIAINYAVMSCIARGVKSGVEKVDTDTRSSIQYLVKLVRKQNRKLFKGARSHLRNTAPRFIKGFQRYDKVKFNNKECFIMGRRITGSFDVRTLGGEKLSASISCKKLKLLESAQTWLWELRTCGIETPIPPTTKVVGLLGEIS